MYQVLLDPGRRHLFDRDNLLSLPPVAEEDQEGRRLALVDRRPLPRSGLHRGGHQVHSLRPPLCFLGKEIEVNYLERIALPISSSPIQVLDSSQPD